LFIQQKTIIDPANRDMVHHLLMYECNPTTVFDDNNLPDGVCDDIYRNLTSCRTNVAGGWAVGADDVSFRNQSFTLQKSDLNRL
jgi:hypothetical protein